MPIRGGFNAAPYNSTPYNGVLVYSTRFYYKLFPRAAIENDSPHLGQFSFSVGPKAVTESIPPWIAVTAAAPRIAMEPFYPRSDT